MVEPLGSRSSTSSSRGKLMLTRTAEELDNELKIQTQKHFDDHFLVKQANEQMEASKIKLKKKNAQIVAYKLQNCSLMYRLNNYRNDERQALDAATKQIEDLQFEITMLKRMRDQEIDHLDQNHVDMVR